jgi:SprT-like protein
MNPPDLKTLFDEINAQHFESLLDLPNFRWNSRLRSSAGRFMPGSRKLWALSYEKAVIEVASYLLDEKNSFELIRDTLAHEMIHYWLWLRRRPYGHTDEFYQKMTEMGVSRYNPVPRTRPYKYLYRCPECMKEFKTRRKLGPLACAQCCRQHSRGKFDSRFKLVLEKSL